MQESEINAWTIPTIIWIVLVTLAWSGCGPGRTMQLANGYECHIDKAFISISHPDDFGEAVHDAGEFDLVGDLVFGTRVKWASDQVTGYFILDTKAGKLEEYQSAQKWKSRLDELGLTSENVRWPGPFFNGIGWGFKLACIVLLILFVSLIYGIVGPLARHEREMRRQKLERL